MDTHHDDESLVQVLLTLRAAEGSFLPDELLWAAPVEAGEGGGTYRLLHPAIEAPLTLDDVVTCRLDGHGRLRIVEVDEPAPRMHTGLAVPAGTHSAVIEQLVAAWGETWNCLSWVFGPLVLTAWPTTMDVYAVDAVLIADVDSRPGWEVIGLAEPHERTTAMLAGLVDFDLVVAPPASTEDGYWAADDATWARLGVTESEALTEIQALAASHPRVVPAIRAGMHQDVLLLMSRLAHPDPANLPPLDRPLFERTGG